MTPFEFGRLISLQLVTGTKTAELQGNALNAAKAQVNRTFQPTDQPKSLPYAATVDRHSVGGPPVGAYSGYEPVTLPRSMVLSTHNRMNPQNPINLEDIPVTSRGSFRRPANYSKIMVPVRESGFATATKKPDAQDAAYYAYDAARMQPAKPNTTFLNRMYNMINPNVSAADTNYAGINMSRWRNRQPLPPSK